jgi:hypothetical protein
VHAHRRGEKRKGFTEVQYASELLESFLAGTRLDLTPFCNQELKIV